ncbi:uncharacterized protein EAF01_003880 [Botrytis porri]|uniref:uncharacterized protein n=1 Tax=Botrytis porri TaxID=87229 RepID=UPI0018FFF4BB|nr:uncharacterized protein EAF01_003880 [Botrytis porri]KAF7908125.1 hypothetical protein EAF01_003880 [Botrytis porri]
MGNPRLKTAFDGMDAPRLRELLNKLCESGKFTVDDPMGKIEVDGRNIVVSNGFIDLTQSDDSDGKDEQYNNGRVGSYNDEDDNNEEELAKTEADDGEVAIVDDASWRQAVKTNQQVGRMGELKIDQAVRIVKSVDQQTNKGDDEASKDNEGYDEEELEADSWDNSDDDNHVPALRKSEIEELLSPKKDYLEEMYAKREKRLRDWSLQRKEI